MAELSPARANIYQEEVQYKAGVSESTFSKLGSSVNFVNMRQYDQKGFFINGPYSIIAGTQTGIDGAFGVLFDCEIVGYMMFNLVAGSSGTTELNILRHTASGAGTTIFSTRPTIDSSAGNNAFCFRDVLNSVTLEAPAGTSVGAISTVNLTAGDMLTCDITNKQTGGQNCGIILFMRPR